MLQIGRKDRYIGSPSNLSQANPTAERAQQHCNGVTPKIQIFLPVQINHVDCLIGYLPAMGKRWVLSDLQNQFK